MSKGLLNLPVLNRLLPLLIKNTGETYFKE